MYLIEQIFSYYTLKKYIERLEYGHKSNLVTDRYAKSLQKDYSETESCRSFFTFFLPSTTFRFS